MKETNEAFTTSSSTATNKCCANCGFELTADQQFCPSCGTKYELQVSAEVSNAIAQFNQKVVKQKTAKTNKKILITILVSIVVLLVVLSIFVYFFFNSQADRIIKEIKSESPSVSAIETQYDNLTPIGEFLFKDRIVTAFAKHVSENDYTTPYVLGHLVNEEALAQYTTYKAIADALDIKANHKTHIVEHIDCVLKLKSYEKYNDLGECIESSFDYYLDFCGYLEDAAEISSYYMLDYYLGKAYTAIGNALTAANRNSSGNTLCNQYIQALETIKEEVGDLYYDVGYFSSNQVSTAMTTISDLVDQMADAENEVSELVSDLPEISF